MILGATRRVWLRASGAWAGFLLVLVLAGGSGGCGPVGYINQVTRRADASVAAARAVDAERWAPYWYTLAVEYLHKAREEAALADFEAANRFGRRAHEAAVTARTLAVERAARPEDTEWMPPPALREQGKASGSEVSR